MAVSMEKHHTGDAALRSEVAAAIEHVLADRPGNWRVSIVGSLANDRWEMQIAGPRVLSGRIRWKEVPGSIDPR